jgi:hypothetical protein
MWSDSADLIAAVLSSRNESKVVCVLWQLPSLLKLKIMQRSCGPDSWMATTSEDGNVICFFVLVSFIAG